jgi:hypothetical protein
MSRQYFADMMAEPKIASLTAITATTETALWDVANLTPIPANDPKPGKCYQLMASGILSTGASGTLIITPRYGLVIGGVSLGPSITQTMVINLSNVAWFMNAIMTIRAVGLAGTTSTVSLGGHFQAAGAAATAGSGIDMAFGGTIPTNVDVSVAGGLWIGWTLSVAGSVQPLNVIWRSLN